ncbi:hypothetical protein KIPB_009488, partial [Kipferlia bialata]|eukprot:g9488.t1
MRTRTVTSTDSEGRTTSRLEHYSETVVTWRGEQAIAVTGWFDATLPLYYPMHPVVRVKLHECVHMTPQTQGMMQVAAQAY